ncbi:MAG: hypothetical protein M0C28_24245 [Candidatus Moduliflexus flocculans]|nr:hypothetical protein [Candidatus Moduliflexus flocculans]
MDDRDLCWLALNLVFYGPSAATRARPRPLLRGHRRLPGGPGRLRRAPPGRGGRRGHRVGAGRRPGRAGIGKNRTEGVYSFDP